jgi:NAD(P)H dehydrogenase (quinone)
VVPLRSTSQCDVFFVPWSDAEGYSLRIPETLSDEVLGKMHAPPKPNYPVFAAADLAQFDAFVFGIPTRYGNFPGQWKVRIFSLNYSCCHQRRGMQAFWDQTGALWAQGALAGKYASVFVSTGTPGGGQGTSLG